MKIIKLSAELLEQGLIQGRQLPASKINKGLPPNCKLVNAIYKQKDRILELWFTEIEDCKEMDLEIEEISNAPRQD